MIHSHEQTGRITLDDQQAEAFARLLLVWNDADGDTAPADADGEPKLRIFNPTLDETNCTP